MLLFCFFNDTVTTAIYTLSLHDALPISRIIRAHGAVVTAGFWNSHVHLMTPDLLEADQKSAVTLDHAFEAMLTRWGRSEEHTSELQSQFHLVCRLLLEKKNK